MAVDFVKAGTTKLCTDCGEQRPLVDFKATAFGRSDECAACVAARRPARPRHAPEIAEQGDALGAEMRSCAKCGTPKPTGAYASTRGGGLMHMCRECFRGKVREGHKSRSGSKPGSIGGVSPSPPCAHYWYCGDARILAHAPAFYETHLVPDDGNEWQLCINCGDAKQASLVNAVSAQARHAGEKGRQSQRDERAWENEGERKAYTAIRPPSVIVPTSDPAPQETPQVTILPRNGSSNGLSDAGSRLLMAQSGEEDAEKPDGADPVTLAGHVLELRAELKAKDEAIGVVRAISAELAKQVCDLQEQFDETLDRACLAEVRLDIYLLQAEKRIIEESLAARRRTKSVSLPG